MNIQITPFAWVMCALICALPVAAFFKTKYPSFFARARVWRACVSCTQKNAENAAENNAATGTEKPDASASTPAESFFARFLTEWFRLAFVFEICMFLFTNLGCFVKINGTTVSYDFVASFVLFVLSVCMICMGKVDKKILWCGVALMAAVGISALSCAVRPYRPGVIYEFDNYVWGKPYGVYLPKVNFLMFKTAFSFLRAVAALSVARKVFSSRGQWAELSGIFARFIRLIVCVGVVEFCIKKFGNIQPVQDFLNRFFGEAIHTHMLADRMQGLYKEPSHYSI